MTLSNSRGKMLEPGGSTSQKKTSVRVPTADGRGYIDDLYHFQGIEFSILRHDLILYNQKQRKNDRVRHCFPWPPDHSNCASHARAVAMIRWGHKMERLGSD